MSAAILSNESKETATVTSSVVGISGATSAMQSIIRPFMNLIQDFWLYGFHIQLYPQFVEDLTNEIDVLNELRIKPQFMDYRIDIDSLTSENLRLNGTQILHSRAPDSKLMLQSIKDIYTVNLAMVIATFVLLRSLSVLFSFVKHKHNLLKKIWRLFRSSSLWWTLIVGFFEPNIVPIIFYGSIQFNLFFCFNSLTKYNLVFSVVMFFATLAYSFLFYLLMHRYSRHSTWKEICEFSVHRKPSFFL